MMTSCSGSVATAVAVKVPATARNANKPAHVQLRLVLRICGPEHTDQKLPRSFICSKPGFVPKKAMLLVRENQRLCVHTLRTKPPHQISCLIERHAAIVIAMNKQYR